MADLNKIVPAATLSKTMAFEQHELLRKALGGGINQLLSRMKEDGQTIKVAANKIKELGHEVSILKKDFAKNINNILAVQPEAIVIEFARALVSANIQRRPAEPQWQDDNKMLWQIVNDFNKHYSGSDGSPYYTPINLDIDANKAKKPAIKLTEKKKKVKVVDGERSANDTVDLVAPPAVIEVGMITTPAKKVAAKKVLTFAIFPEGQKTANQELVLNMTNILTTRKKLESEPVQNILRLAKKYLNNPNKFANDLVNTFTKKHVSQKKFLELLPHLEKTNLKLVEASLILFGTNIVPDPVVEEVPVVEAVEEVPVVEEVVSDSFDEKYFGQIPEEAPTETVEEMIDTIIPTVEETKEEESCESGESNEPLKPANNVTYNPSYEESLVFEVKIEEPAKQAEEDSRMNIEDVIKRGVGGARVNKPSKSLPLGQRISTFFKNLFSKGQ